MQRAVLMIAYHFPPAAMGSGHLRTLGFARYLPDLDWDPIVLSARPLAYPRTSRVDTDVIPQGCVVRRTLAFDASRHFAVAGRYPAFLAQPDRWISWWPAAVLQGLRLIRHHQIRAIWSTYPIMTAHCIARTLSAITGLPWIADFRDPVSSSVEPGNRYSVASQHRWERRVLQSAARVVFTTHRAMADCAESYPDAYNAGRLAVIENGYDESAFAGITCPLPASAKTPLVLLHSGLLYAEGRNPLPFFNALAQLKDSRQIGAGDVKIILRASGSEVAYSQAIQRLGLEELVTLAPPVSNREALVEQAAADALLLFQGSKFDRQIPAKVYEYLRIGRPIFALVGPDGATAAVLRHTGGAELVAPEDADAIRIRLAAFIAAVRDGSAATAGRDVVATYSRKEGAHSLAHLLQQVCG